MPLSELKCIVTGASSGIGRATCEVLTSKGATVIGTGRNESSLKYMKDLGYIHDYVVADLTKLGECKRMVETSTSLLGGNLTTVVNSAGVLYGGAMGEVGMENYHNNMICNTQVPFEIMIHSIPYLKQQQQGKQQDKKNDFSSACIVNVSSVNGKQAFAGCVAYCMSKAAIDQLTRCASVDLAKFGIRVNSVNPGVIETNLQKAGGLSEEQYQQFLKRSIDTTHPIAKFLGRVGQPKEVGELIAFLVSKEAKFITGECIAIDGGRQNLGAR